MERRSLRRAALVVAAIILVAATVAYAVLTTMRAPSAAPGLSATATDVHVPAGVRIRVEVLNASRVPGLARRATLHLRDCGFDVVQSGNARQSLDSTLVIDRTAHAQWAHLVAQAMGGARVVARPDTSRDLDVTVLVGAAWRPPAKPFYP